ncbi:heparan-alpha-glucosaminide N-acetyltransferase domain-containing protein [Pseudonocardia sp. CA-107938]|uniref:heparan-alpha-glucosaminide N-acetyltransferase domain-containing protein n=1 Tax=Pseudonocardia sp. CA-107938 TaxID=3240021 RepID=UPI003D8FCD6F
MPPRDRIRGIDAARAVALIGMVATHILETERSDGSPTLVGFLFDGRASALFAVLAGTGLALATRGLPDGRAQLAAGAGIAVRAALIAVIGLVLADLDPRPLVILAYYGVLFLVAIPLLRVPAGALAALAVVWCGLSPVLSHLLRDEARYPAQVGLEALADPAGLLWTLTVAGVYPVLTWTTYLLAGLAVGRTDLRSPRVATVLLAGGAALSAAASGASALLLDAGGAAVLGRAATTEFYGTTPTGTWWWLAVDAPHSGTPFDLARTTGSALAVLGFMLLLARVAAPLLWLPAAIGAAPLTLYVLHTVLTTVDVGADPDPLPLFLGHVVLLAVAGAALSVMGARGPLEAAVSAASRSVRTRVLAAERARS